VDGQGSASGPDPARITTLDDLARELGLLRSRAARGTRSARVSLEELAGRMGEPRSTIHAYLTGRRLAPAEVLDRMVIALGASSAEQHEWAEAWYRVTANRDAAHRGAGAERAIRTGIPHQLPPAVDNFLGRAGELAELSRLFATGRRDQGGRPGPIVAVTGTAGVGKTALAVHWAHAGSGDFPDGQLYLDLRGSDPEPPVQPGQALAGFLRALGVAGTEIPRDLAERAALYRSLLSGRKVLVLLDNARDVEQVRNLLPGTPSCAVLVTSRDSLTGLVARHGGHRLELDVLPPPDAVRLLRALGGPQVDAEPDAALALAEHCAGLPLALRIAAERTGHRPGTPLADLVREFAGRQAPLDLLEADEDARTSLRAVLSWSYSRLAPDAARAFRLLGLYPGGSVRPAGLAALLGTAGVAEARHLLDVLARAHLVRQSGPDRYQLHRLLLAFAGELAVAQDSAPERRLAGDRLLEYYLDAAAQAMDLLYPAPVHRRPEPAAGHPPAVRLADATAARDWLDAEQPTLVALAGQAGQQGWPRQALRLADLLADYLDDTGQVGDALAVHAGALAAARLCDDHAAEARAVRRLARTRGCLAEPAGTQPIGHPDPGELEPAGQSLLLHGVDATVERPPPALRPASV